MDKLRSRPDSVHNSSFEVNSYHATNKSAYLDVVTVRPVSDTTIRKLGIVRDFGLGFGVFIGSVTHGPSSTV